MLTCNKTDKMVVDAPNSNGPFQPVALMHFRGTYGRIILPVRPSDTERESCVFICSRSPSLPIGQFVSIPSAICVPSFWKQPCYIRIANAVVVFCCETRTLRKNLVLLVSYAACPSPSQSSDVKGSDVIEQLRLFSFIFRDINRNIRPRQQCVQVSLQADVMGSFCVVVFPSVHTPVLCTNWPRCESCRRPLCSKQTLSPFPHPYTFVSYVFAQANEHRVCVFSNNLSPSCLFFPMALVFLCYNTGLGLIMSAQCTLS